MKSEMSCCLHVFFFQAEDGIRDVAVTGVQTCALPIFGIAVGLERAEHLDPGCLRPQSLLDPASTAVQHRRPRVGHTDDDRAGRVGGQARSEEHTSELQSRLHLVCRLLLEKKKKNIIYS